MSDDQTGNWWPVSLSILDGHGYAECLPEYFPYCGPGNDATAMREPLPVYLFAAVAAVHRSLEAAGSVQLLLQLLLIVAIYGMVREMAGERTALIAAAIWTVYLPGLLVITQIAGDLVATLTVTLGLWCYLRAWRTGKTSQWALAGACLALAVLSRSALLVIAMPLGIAVLWHGWRTGARHFNLVKPALAFALAWSMVMLPWIVRNEMVFHQPVVGSTLTGYNILRHNHQLPSDDPYRYINEDEARPIIYAALARHTELTGRENEAQVDRIYKAEGLAIIKANKARYLVLSAYRSLALWFNWGVYSAYGKQLGPLDFLMAAQQALLLLLALVGLRYAPRRAWPLFFAVVVLSLAYMAIVTRMRYIIPVMPVVILLAAIAIDKLLSRWMKKRSSV
ncbi:MAG: glycosyltransferase family 39 protein [Flavobacteriales bacterium]